MNSQSPAFDEAVQRLKTEMLAHEHEERQQGKDKGRRWVEHKNGASVRSLKGLEELAQIWDQWLGCIENAYSPSENAYFLIDPADEGDRQAASRYWTEWADQEDPSSDFLTGFIEGAMEAWHKVQERL